jgi:hypothetical protein
VTGIERFGLGGKGRRGPILGVGWCLVLLGASVVAGVPALPLSAQASSGYVAYRWVAVGKVGGVYKHDGRSTVCADGPNNIGCSRTVKHSNTYTTSVDLTAGLSGVIPGVEDLTGDLGFQIGVTREVSLGTDLEAGNHFSVPKGKIGYIDYYFVYAAQDVQLDLYGCKQPPGRWTTTCGDTPLSDKLFWTNTGRTAIASGYKFAHVAFSDHTVKDANDVPLIRAGSATTNGGFENAFQANTGDLWSDGYQSAGLANAAGSVLQLASGTSPGIADVQGDNEIAFQGTDNDLWMSGPDGQFDSGLGMMPGTSPAITPLFTGGYEVAFQANTGAMWTYGTAGTEDWNAGMAAGTSPSITWHGGSGYEVALQTNTDDLWMLGDAGDVDYHLGMQPGTSPSITVTSADGVEIAFQANTSSLWTVGSAGWKDWNAGMDPHSSPSITAAAGGYEVALQTNTHDLWTLGTDGYNDWHLGMMPGTSPAIGSVSSGGAGYEMTFQANNGNLWNAGTDGTGGNVYGMAPGTSPSITSN